MQENSNNDNGNPNISNNNIMNASKNIIHVNYTKNESFLSKKRNPKINQEKYIEHIKKLIIESGIDKNYLRDKLFPPELDAEKKEEINKEKKINCENKNKNKFNHLQQTNSLKEWYEKINLLPKQNKELKEIVLDENDEDKFSSLNWALDDDIEEENNNIIQEFPDGKIIFNGKKNNSHYIYMKNSYKFNISIENKKYSWKIKFLSTSNLIGVGLAYPNIVQKNKNKFLDEKESDFNNGIFALIQTYNPLIKKYRIRPWNCLDKNSANYVAEFPKFKKGKEIIISYDTNKEKIEFKIKNNVHIMSNIKLNGNKNNNNKNIMMTPCVVFYQKGDEIQFCEFKEDTIIINNNNDNKEIINIDIDNDKFIDIDDY